MSNILNNVYQWLNVNRLSLNIEKTVFVTYGAYKNSIPNNIDIQIGTHNLTRVDHCKYLGVTFDCFLKWDYQIVSTVKRTRYLLFVLKKMSSYTHTNVLRVIYFALFQNLAFYGIIAWGGAYNNVLKPLANLQNRLLKTIKANNMLNLKQAFILEAIVHNYDELKYKFLASESKTRGKSIEFTARKSLNFKNHSIIAIPNFNRLPNYLKNLELTKKNIKSKIKNYLYSKPNNIL